MTKEQLFVFLTCKVKEKYSPPIAPQMSSILQDDLGMDSIEILELVCEIEREFDIHIKEMSGLYYFGDLVDEVYFLISEGRCDNFSIPILVRQ